MKKTLYIIACLLIICTIANAQSFSSGKYLLSSEGANVPDACLTFSFEPDGSINEFFPVEEKNYAGSWESMNQVLSMHFEGLRLRNFGGLYEVIPQTNGYLKLKGKHQTLYLLPFDEQKIGVRNALLNIEGKWEAHLYDDVYLQYDFQLPNVVDVCTVTKNNNEEIRETLFWQAFPEKNQFIIYPDLMVPNVGLFKDVKVEKDVLEFNLFGDFHRLTRVAAKEQHIKRKPMLLHPSGKCLITIYAKGKQNADLMLTAVEITNDNKLVALQADGEEPETIADLQFSKKKVNMQFIPFLSDCSGDYKIQYETHGIFSFIGEKKEITVYPFEPDEIGNREMGITGKWYCKEGDTEITLDFQLPNVVHIVEKQGGFTLDEYSFWGSVPNGEDIFITAVPIFNPFAGTLKQIHVKDNVLHFDYNSKHYVMTRKK